MKKYIFIASILAGLVLAAFQYSSAQENVILLTASLDSQTPAAKSLQAGEQGADVAKITLTASGGDIYIDSVILGADVAGGLNNFTNILLYRWSPFTYLGSYPAGGENPNIIRFSPLIIGNGSSKTFLLRANLASSAAGNVRVGFSGFTFPTEAKPSLSGVPIYGNVMTLPGSTPTPSPEASAGTATPTPSPSAGFVTPASLGFTSLSALSLNDGDVISSAVSGDPDIYIVNNWGYKRLFLNPAIFGFYGHLGGFSKVKNVPLSSRNMLVPSGLFRNCETNDSKVYGLEVTGEDSGVLHWVNTSGEQAVADDSDFFKKVFCINTKEFNWYSKGNDYTAVSQVPAYIRD